VQEPEQLELRRYLRSQRALTAQLVAHESLDQVASGFVATVAELLRWKAGAIWEVTEGAPALRFVSGWSVPKLDAEPLWKLSRELSFERGVGLPGRAWETGEVVWLADVRRDPNFPRRPAAVELGLQAALAIPVPLGPPERVLAVAEFHSDAFDSPSEDLVDLLATFADQLGAFIERRRAETEIRAGEQFKSAVLASSLDCIVGMDHRGLVVEFNEAAERLFGYRRDEALGRELAELIIPEELRDRHRESLRRYLETGQAMIIGRRLELPAKRSDGSTVPVELTVTRLSDSDPPLFTGFLREISERVEAERVRHHLAEVVRGSQDAVLSKDLEGMVTSWNPAAERLYGYSREEAIGQHISFLIPMDHKDEEKEILARVRRGERIETYETERIRKDGARIDVSLTVSPIEQPVLGIVGASVIARDITAEKRRRRAQEFLVAATRGLDASLDFVETARTIVATAVPELATVCVMDFVRRDGLIGDSVVAAADPDVAARLERIRKQMALDPDGEHPVAQVLRAGRPMVWRDLTSPAVIGQVAQNEEHRNLMSDAGYNSAAVVALVARGRTLGAVSFLHASTDLRYDDADLELLGELADRAAIALDNARLYQERDQTARSLQRGLRPPRPAEVPGLEISVVFEAAGEGIEIGGDLYDVLPTDDGCWILIGDVAGKGSAAAGVSVAVRHAVRGLTREIEDPAEVLSRVNELLLEGTSLNDFATVMLIRMHSGASGWTAVLAAAGHPPAIHVKREGPAQLGGGSILGALPEARLARHDVVLDHGDTLVLCTDGWLEAGPPATHAEPDALAEMSHSLSNLELDQLTVRLRQDAIARGGGALRDDMVVLAVRPAGGSHARRDEGSARTGQLSPL
jgi:PAS domain S-box-containing protein